MSLISTELPEFDLYHPASGHPDWHYCLAEAEERAETVRQQIVTETDLGWRDRAADLRRKSSALGKFATNAIVNRRRYRRGDHALRPLYTIWTMLNSCNFGCTYCDNHQGEHYYDVSDPNRLGTAKAKELLGIIRTGSPALYWCGGEPTMRKDLPELLDYAWHRGFFPNIINTNGSLLYRNLQRPAWSKFLWQMDMVVVSLDGLNLNRLNHLWQVKKSREVIVNLLMMRELRKHIRFKLAVNTVITPDTIDEARSVLDLANDLEFGSCQYPSISNTNPTILSWKTQLTRSSPAQFSLARNRVTASLVQPTF